MTAPLNAPQKTLGGATIFTARVARTHGPDDPLLYERGRAERRDVSELRRIADQLAGKPLTLLHPDGFVSEGAQAQVIGSVLAARVVDDHVVAELAVHHPDGQAAIARGVREISLGYESRVDARGYQQDIDVDHVALVPRARCGPSCAVRADACSCGGACAGRALRDAIGQEWRDGGQEWNADRHRPQVMRGRTARGV